MTRNREIAKEFRELKSFAEIAREYKLSSTTIRKIVIRYITQSEIDLIKKTRSNAKKFAREKLWNERYFKDPVYRKKTIERAKARYKRLYPPIKK